MSWKDAFHAEVKKYIESPDRYDQIKDVKEVTKVSSDRWDDGYCDTCSYEYDVVIIDYINLDGYDATTTFRMSMPEFMEGLE